MSAHDDQNYDGDPTSQDDATSQPVASTPVPPPPDGQSFTPSAPTAPSALWSAPMSTGYTSLPSAPLPPEPHPTFPSMPGYPPPSAPYMPPAPPYYTGPQSTPSVPPAYGGPPSAPYGSPHAPPYFGSPYGPPPQQPRQALSRRIWSSTAGRATVIATSILLIAAIGLAVILTHRPALPNGYLFTQGTSEAAFVSWTEDSSQHLTGTLQDAYVTSDRSTGMESVQTYSSAFTDVRNGSDLSLTFTAADRTVTGSLDGEFLTLGFPAQDGSIETDVFHAASVRDYNNAVGAIHQSVQTQNNATQSAQATATTQAAEAQATAQAQSTLDNAVINANNQLANDIGRLDSDAQNLAGNTDFSNALDGYASDWSTMQHDWQQEQTDYQGGCPNASQVQYDTSVVNYDLSTIQYQDSVLSYDENVMSSPLQAVQQDMQMVKNDWQNLQAAVAADTTEDVSAQFTQSDVDSALSKAQKQIDASNGAEQQAQTKAKQYDQEANQTNNEAQQLANSMHC